MIASLPTGRLPPAQVAHVLAHALPYIRRFTGKTVVVKMGGGAMTDAGLNSQLALDVLLLQSVGVRLVLVHGGGSATAYA